LLIHEEGRLRVSLPTSHSFAFSDFLLGLMRGFIGGAVGACFLFSECIKKTYGIGGVCFFCHLTVAGVLLLWFKG
jgi:hypothetical protein